MSKYLSHCGSGPPSHTSLQNMLFSFSPPRKALRLSKSKAAQGVFLSRRLDAVTLLLELPVLEQITERESSDFTALLGFIFLNIFPPSQNLTNFPAKMIAGVLLLCERLCVNASSIDCVVRALEGTFSPRPSASFGFCLFDE